MIPANYTEIFFEEIDSTNKYAMNNLATLSDRTVVVASIQTNGVGRLNREWLSEKKDNLYMTIVLKPSFANSTELPLSSLTQYLSIVLCRLLNEFSVNAEIKWPNDTLVNGKKIAGILSQSSIIGTKIEGCVLGVGVNLNLSENDISKISQPATSLNLLIGKQVDSVSFRKKLITLFFDGYEDFMRRGFASIREEYLERSTFIGKTISVSINGKINTGTAGSISNDGALVFLNSNNEQKIITTGEMVCS